MRLAILTQYYPPEVGAPQHRLSDLAARMAQRGHTVQVLTALPNYPGHAIHPGFANRANSVKDVQGVRVARVNIHAPRDASFSERMACYLSFAWNARRHGPRLLLPFDVLLLESPPLFTALAGVPIARRFGARLVVNVSDLWPQSAVDLGVIGDGPALWSARRLEAWMYRQANLITGQTIGIVRDIAGRFPDKAVELYPNGVDCARYEQAVDRRATRRDYGWRDDEFVVGYTGTIGHAQAFDQVVDAADRLRDSHHTRIAVFGDGPCRRSLEAAIRARNLTNLSVHGVVPYDRIPLVQTALDAGLVPLARGRVFEGARPSKLFELMAARLPLVVCGRGEVETIVNGGLDGPVGVTVSPEDSPALADAIRSLSMNRADALAMGRRGAALAQREFDRGHIATRFEAILVGLTSSGSPLRAGALPIAPA